MDYFLSFGAIGLDGLANTGILDPSLLLGGSFDVLFSAAGK
jgi:hypothetical protein